MADQPTPDPNLPVSVERDGVILSGGTSVEALEATLERRNVTPAPDASVESPDPEGPAAPIPPRDEETGKFVKPSRGARRLNALSAEAKAAQEERDAAWQKYQDTQKERDELKAQLEAARRPEPVRQPEPVKEAPKAAPKPTIDQFLNDPDPYSSLAEAIADWKLDAFKSTLPNVEQQIRQTLDREREQQTFREQLTAVQTKARAVYSDYDTVLQTGPGVMVLLGPTVESANARLRAIVQMPGSEHLQYAIAKDATLAHKLAAVSDIEFGRILSELATASAVGSPAATEKTGFVPPPAPHSPVGSGSKTMTPSSSELAQKGSYDFDKSGYREKRAAERGMRR